MKTRICFAILCALIVVSGDQLHGVEVAASTEDLLAMSPEMIEFLEANVYQSADASQTAASLLSAIVGSRGLALDYADTRTRTALDTFTTRNGNCLSFTVLFVAMARHLGLRTTFNEVMEVLSWGRHGNVVWSSRHMIAEVATSAGMVQVDFLPELEKRYRSPRRISDQRMLAHYYNNLGAETFSIGDHEAALVLFRRSLEVDDTFTPAWVNNGVALRRLGRREEAEKSYLRALEIDPSEMTAASNLALLYAAMSRAKDAEPYFELVSRYRKRNPFYHFSLGLEASRNGELKAAVKHMSRAIRRQRKDAGFRAELAEVYLDLGRERKAKRSLKRAIYHAVGDEERDQYQRRLLLVQTGAVGHRT
jgi:Flp pilus assembly protein TadD